MMRLIRRFPAGAIQTSVFAACPAIAGEFVAEVFARPVKPDGEVVAGQAEIERNLSGILAIEINALEQLAVGGGHGGQQAPEAFAEQTLIGRGGRCGQLHPEPLKRAVPCRVATIQIDDGMAQNPVKPGQGIFLVGGLFRSSQRLCQTFLNHVFRQIRVPDTVAGKCHKGLQVLDQRFLNTLHAAEPKQSQATP
jgi:hypothetical protein